MDDPAAVAKEKFNDLQKYVPFLEKFISCVNSNEQSGNEFVEKRKKCLKLLGMLKNDFSERLKLTLLVNIEDTVKKLMEQSGDRLIQSKSYKKEPPEQGNQSPNGLLNHASTSKDRKDIRNTYDEEKHRSLYDKRRSEHRSRSPDSYRNRSPIDHRRRSPENYRVRRSSRSSERYKSDHRHRMDFKRGDKSKRSRSRERHFHRDQRRSDEGYRHERSYDHSGNREKFESNDSYSHRNRHDSSYMRDNRDKNRYTNSKVRSVFDRLEPRTSNKSSVKRQQVPNGRSRFESNAEWNDGSPPRKIIVEDFSELETLTQNRFGRSKEDDQLSEIMERQHKAEQLRAELKKQEEMEIANKLLNEIQSTGDYVRKDSNSVISSLDKGKTRQLNKSSEQIDRIESLPNSENSTPSQRIAVAPQGQNELIMNQSSSRLQYISPWLNQQSDPRQRNINESGLHVTVPPRVFGQHVTSHGNGITSDQSLQAFHAFGNSSNMSPINPLHNNNENLLNSAFPIVGQPIHNELYPVHGETVPIITSPPLSQNSNSHLNSSHQHIPNRIQSNERSFNKNPTHNSSVQMNRKANMKYGQYKRARESLDKTNRCNILVTTTTAPGASSIAEEQLRNEKISKTATHFDSTRDSNKKDTPAKNASGSSDKRSENVPANSSTNTSTQNKSINNYRIPKLNRTDSTNNSKQQNQLQEPSREKGKSRKSSNQKHAEKAIEKTPIRTKTKDKDRRRSENFQVLADTTTDSEEIQKTSSSRNESNVVDSNSPAVEHDNDDVVSSSTSRRESSGSTALNSSLSDSNERPNKEKRKTAKTKKNELDRLNEDIMANCNDVVMATGKRACTITSRKGLLEDSISRTASDLDESNSGESSDEIDKAKAKRKKIVKSKRQIDDKSDDSETGYDEISLPRTRPGPKCAFSSKKPLEECLVVLERLDEATINQYTKQNEDKIVSCIKNTNPKMTAMDSKECVICKKSYRQLVRHYNSVHEGFEVYCSRMSVENSNKIRKGQNIQKVIYDKGKPSVRCPFCDKHVRKDSTGRLIDHFMTHTGEFIKKCNKCGLTVDANTAKTSNCAHNKQRQENIVQFTDNIFVFMCNICNYVQSQEDNLKKHIMTMHEIKLNVFEQYKKIVLVTNVRGRRRTNNKESESNDGEISNQEAFKPTEQNDDSNEEHTIQIIEEISFEPSSNVQTARKRTMADQLHERLGGGQSSAMKPESGEDAINIVLRGADEVSDDDTEKTNISSDPDYLTGEAIENMYKIEIAKEEFHTLPNVKNGNNGNNDEEDWESCSTGSDDDDQSDGKFNNKMSTRLTSVLGKSKISKTKFKSKKRNDKSIFGAMSCKIETLEGIVNLMNEDDNINAGASTSQQFLGIESSMKDDSKRIENFAYTKAETQIKYTCYIGNCNFISLNNSSSFSNHLRMQHSEAWKGYCHSCDKQILNGSFSLMKEFNHMMEIHLPDVNKPNKTIRSLTSDLVLKSNSEPISSIEEKITKPPEPEKPVFRLKLRRLSGDLLSGPAASDTGIIISSVTSVSESENNMNDQQLSVETMEEDNATDNLMKPWTKCPNRKSAVASTKLSRQISLVALFKCMAIDCIFTTSDRSAMLTHLNNHEDFLMQPTNSLLGYTDSDSWLECCYCEKILDSCTLLVDHIEQQHSSSIFQCAYCFYRSVDPCNVNSHINSHHKDKHRMVLICGTHPKCLSEEIDILTSKSKNLKRVQCTFPGCDDSFWRLNDLNNHLDQSHGDKTYFRCPFCPMRLSKSEIGGIDVTHFQYHNIALYHCAHCPEYETMDPDSMQTHLRDEHPNHLAYAVARFDNGLLNTELDASIARAYRSEKYYLCHSSFTPDQIDFMNPSLSEYVANSGEVPNKYQDLAKAKANEITFKQNLQLERKTREHLYKKYHIYTFDQLNTGSWKTSSIQIKDNLDKQLSQNEGAVTFNDTTGQVDYITSIQNEIDASAKALLNETGVPNESIYHCGFTDCHWIGSSMEGNAFLDHLSHHNLIDNSHKCYHCNVEFCKPIELKIHIDATHSIDRYFCFLCNNTEASEQCMIEHFKSIHKNNFMHFIPLNPCQIDRTKDIFVGCPLNISFINDFGMKLIERKENKMLTKKYYSPEELNLLPNRQVFIDDVYCKRCNYRTKVRLNMERHLPSCKGSSLIETNPEQAPVNPVPHLDTGEMHSDKMKNLAASSNLTGDSTIDKDLSLRYVPETERFMCGADGCSYRTIASECLQEHLECSHKDQATYYCPLCRTEIVGGVSRSVEIINHLRLHSELIFKCSVCLYGHYEKNEVELHISDVHPKATVQKIIRPQKQTEFIKPVTKSIISKWKCNICTNKFNSKILVKQHLSTDHQIKHNYQCDLCTFQDDAKARIKEHLWAVHSQNDASKLKIFFEQIGIDNDNSPLWKRDDPTRIKHIRGIPFEDEEITDGEISNVKATVHRKQTWTCDIPSFASKSNTNKDRFVIVPSKNTFDESALEIERSQSVPTRQMPKRRASMFVSSQSELMSSSSSTPQPPIPKIRFKRVNIDENLMPPPAKVLKVYGSRNNSDTNRSSLIYQCDYCATSGPHFDGIQLHWQQVHQKDNSDDPEAKQFRYRVTVQILCVHCNEIMAFASIWEHLSRMHSNAKFAFARFEHNRTADIHCGMCSKRVLNKNDLEVHFSNEHASSINSKAKVQPMPFFNDTIVETLIDQGNHETVKCLYCQETFICTFDYEQHHQQYHPENIESHEPTDSNIIKYGCMECQVYSTNRNNIISHIWKNHIQSRYQCLYCSKQTQYKKLIRTHHELAHKSNEMRYRIVDATENTAPFYRMSMNFPNGLVLFWGDMLKTKFSRVKQLIDHVNELNRAELESYAKSTEPSVNDVPTPGRIGSRRRQTYLL